MLEQIPNDPRAMIAESYRLYFAMPLNPVAPRAQRKVRKLEGLNLDQWIGAPLPDTSMLWQSDEEEQSDQDIKGGSLNLPQGLMIQRGKSDPGGKQHKVNDVIL